MGSQVFSANTALCMSTGICSTLVATISSRPSDAGWVDAAMSDPVARTPEQLVLLTLGGVGPAPLDVDVVDDFEDSGDALALLVGDEPSASGRLRYRRSILARAATRALRSLRAGAQMLRDEHRYGRNGTSEAGNGRLGEGTDATSAPKRRTAAAGCWLPQELAADGVQIHEALRTPWSLRRDRRLHAMRHEDEVLVDLWVKDSIELACASSVVVREAVIRLWLEAVGGCLLEVAVEPRRTPTLECFSDRATLVGLSVPEVVSSLGDDAGEEGVCRCLSLVLADCAELHPTGVLELLSPPHKSDT